MYALLSYLCLLLKNAKTAYECRLFYVIITIKNIKPNKKGKNVENIPPKKVNVHTKYGIDKCTYSKMEIQRKREWCYVRYRECRR